MVKKRKLNIINIMIAVLTLIVVIISIKLVVNLFSKDFKVNIKNLTIETDEEFENNFRATYKGIDVTTNVKIETNLNNKIAGIYEIKYIYTKDNKEYSIIKKIKVIDKISPVISLKGGNDLIIKTNSVFTEPGYVALDNSDGDISDKVVVNGEVDTNKEGVYIIKYYVKDTSDNSSEVIRKVTVTSSSPLEMTISEFTIDGLFSKATLKETERASDEYINMIVFAGDSSALYYVVNEQIKEENLWYQMSITAETIFTSPINIAGENTNKTFIENLQIYKPKMILMTFGTNSVPYMSPEYFYEKYYTFIKELKQASPKTKIIIQSIPPVDKKLDNTSMNNDKINKMNYYIGKMCEELNVKFLNSAPILKDESGTCKQEYCRDDGIHLTKQGQEVLIEFIKTHMYN